MIVCERRSDLDIRIGIVRLVQLSALCLLIYNAAEHHLDTLTGPGYLLVILVGELIDMGRRVLKVLGRRKQDAPKESGP